MHRNNTFPLRPLAGAIAMLALLAAPIADALADSTAYYLDQSQKNVSALPDGTNYLKLEITSNVAGTATFDLTPVFAHTPGRNYGLLSFAFNYSGSALPGSMIFADLPSGWTADLPPAGQFDGYGKFDFIVESKGQDRVPSLNFTISGLGGTTTAETLGYFAKSSTDNAGEGEFYFGAHLADFTANNVSITSVKFAGSTVAAVPEPESYAMLLAGLGFVGALARRRRFG